MLSAKELVALNISALPSDYRNIERRAVRERWAFVTRPSRGRNGKTRLYVVERLPETYLKIIRFA